jgi:ubiquinone/menaquinone biosynthesis C-methylase UbiE
MSVATTDENATKWGTATKTSAARYSRTNGPQHLIGNDLNAMMNIKKGQRVLVTACGPGNDVFTIARIVGPSGGVVGFDLDKHSIEEARQTLEATHPDLKTYVELFVCDAHDMSMFTSQSFDAIHCNASYHWFEDKLLFLTQAVALAVPGACIGITTQDRDFMPPMIDIRNEVLAELGEESADFVFHPNAPELRHDLDAAGWSDVQTSGCYGTYMQEDGMSLWNWLNDSSGNQWGNYLEEGKRERARELTLEKFKGISLPDGRPVMQFKHLFALAYYRG